MRPDRETVWRIVLPSVMMVVPDAEDPRLWVVPYSIVVEVVVCVSHMMTMEVGIAF